MTSPASGAFRLRWWWYAVAGVAGALPSLVWAAKGADFIHDDWGVAAAFRTNGVWDATVDRLTSIGRPLSAVYDGLTYGLLGARPWAHVLVMAALNGLAAVLVLRVSIRLLGVGVAAWVTAVWVALPNRAATRLWIVMGPQVLALCLLLAGVLLLLQTRPVPAGLVMGAGILAYEAVAALALAAVAAFWFQNRRQAGLRSVVASLAPIVVAVAVVFAVSPKDANGTTFFARATTVFAAHWGTGVYGARWAYAGALVVLVAASVALARFVVPGFTATTCDRLVLSGITIALLGAVPYFPGGFPFATDGIFDRGNMMPGLGTALVLGALLSCLISSQAVAGLVAGAVVVSYVGSLNAVDLRDYRQAVQDGAELRRQLAIDVPTIDAPLLVVPQLPNRGGVSQFIEQGDLGAALRLERDDQRILARMLGPDEDPAAASEPLRYDWVRRELTTRP